MPWVSTVTPDAIKHFAWGVGDDNPLWHDSPLAAPPCLLYAVDETTVAPGHADRRRVYEAVDWTWYDVAGVGSVIEAEAQLLDNEVTPSPAPTSIVQLGRSGTPATGR